MVLLQLSFFFLSVVIEGPILDCWTCFHITAWCFKGEYCGGNKDCGMAFGGVRDQVRY